MGHTGIVDILLKNGADPNLTTPVTMLPSLYHTNVLDDITVQDGNTALHVSSKYGHVGAAQVLIEAHTDIDLQDKVMYM